MEMILDLHAQWLNTFSVKKKVKVLSLRPFGNPVF